jgi:hypothetical protein
VFRIKVEPGVAGAKLFFPEEFPDLIAEEAIRLWNM